jgi:proliferating cell nuclear antigen
MGDIVEARASDGAWAILWGELKILRAPLRPKRVLGARMNCLEIRTVQAGAFKTLIEALKELLTDTCVEFDDSGMKVVALDMSHTVLVHLRLDASKFEFYQCDAPITIGVNMLNLHKLIKTINNHDTLTLFIDKDDINHLGVRIENGEKNTRTTYKLNLLDLDKEDMTVPPVEFNSVIAMPATDFQKIIRDMSNLGDFVEVKNINSQLFFTCDGEFCHQETVLSDSSAGVSTINNKQAGEIVQGLFNLKYLVLFTKCTNLCNTIELYLKNDYPIVIKYAVASLGEIKLCLAPQQRSS